MIIYSGGRGNGKTTKLVHLSAETGRPILVGSAERANAIIGIAEREWLDMPKPIVLNKTPEAYSRIRSKEVIIDEVGSFLENLLGVSIYACSSYGLNEETIDKLEQKILATFVYVSNNYGAEDSFHISIDCSPLTNNVAVERKDILRIVEKVEKTYKNIKCTVDYGKLVNNNGNSWVLTFKPAKARLLHKEYPIF